MHRPPTDFPDLQTPVMAPLGLRFDPASRQYYRDDERADEHPRPSEAPT